jgi:hypothetical protein
MKYLDSTKFADVLTQHIDSLASGIYNKVAAFKFQIRTSEHDFTELVYKDLLDSSLEEHLPNFSKPIRVRR